MAALSISFSLPGIKGLPDRQIIPLQKVEWSLQQRRWRRKWAEEYHSKCGAPDLLRRTWPKYSWKDMKALIPVNRWITGRSGFYCVVPRFCWGRYITGAVISVNGDCIREGWRAGSRPPHEGSVDLSREVDDFVNKSTHFTREVDDLSKEVDDFAWEVDDLKTAVDHLPTPS